MSDTIDRLAGDAGIEPTYRDYWGNETHVSNDTKRALLAAIGCDPASLDVPCHLPPELERGRLRVLATQVYALRSARNWGIGDFSDLAALARIAAGGFDVLAINPLHALHLSNPDSASPYAPSSRLFLNPLYVDVEAVPEFLASPAARALAGGAAFRRRLDALRQCPLIDYAGVAAAKREVLETCAAWMRSGAPAQRQAAFAAFVRNGGAALERLAAYEALCETFRARDPNAYGWRQWPAAYRSPHSADVARFAAERRDRVDFFLYLQFVAGEQLRAASDACRRYGVRIYRDLAVGVDANGADAWADQETIRADACLGAPPDALNAIGQNWGLAPLSPRAICTGDYAAFSALLRANMTEAAILRIDHVMALQRAFWIPRGRRALDGAYVRYPFEELLGVLARESARNACTVVGEDLGTVPDGFRERMQRARVLSTRVLYFERNWNDGSFLPPASYPRLAAVSVGTHDLPPLLGWWAGADVALRRRLGLYPSAALAGAAQAERNAARLALVDALLAHGAIGADAAARLRADAERGGTPEAGNDLIDGVHRYIGMTAAALVIVQIEDLLHQTDAVNVPGTWDEHPNWRRKHPVTLEAIASDTRVEHMGRMLA